jgi:hypothetical protein
MIQALDAMMTLAKTASKLKPNQLSFASVTTWYFFNYSSFTEILNNFLSHDF